MKSFIMLCVLAASAMAVPTAHDYQLHERRDFIPESWVEGKKLDGNVSLPVRIGLTQSNLDYGHELLMDLYELAQWTSHCLKPILICLGPTPTLAAMDNICPSMKCTTCLLQQKRV
jgi:hypothetical protein